MIRLLQRPPQYTIVIHFYGNPLRARVRARACVCVCVCERERERESVRACPRASVREYLFMCFSFCFHIS